MKNTEIVEIIQSFDRPHLLLNFVKNFKSNLDVSDEMICMSLLEGYKNFHLEQHLDDLFSFVNPELNENIKEYVKYNFTLYYTDKINTDLFFGEKGDLSLITMNVDEDNLHEYISRGIINQDNIQELMRNINFDISAFKYVLEYYKNTLAVDVDDLWEKLWIQNDKLTSERQREQVRGRAYILYRLHNPPSSKKIDFLIKHFLESSSFKNKDMMMILSNILPEMGEYVIQLIEKNNIKIKKPDDKLSYIFSIIQKEKSLEILHSKKDLFEKFTNTFELMINVLGTKINYSKISFYEQSVLKVIKDEILNKENPSEFIFENAQRLNNIKLYLCTLDDIKSLVMNNFSFDKLKRKYPLITEDSIVYSLIQANKDWKVFFDLFNESKATYRDDFFKDNLIKFMELKDWLAITDVIKKNSPKFYEKEIASKDISFFENNKLIYMHIEKEQLMKGVQDTISDPEKSNKKRL